MKPREPKLGVAVGKKGVGKTYTTNNMLQQYVYGNPAHGVKGRRVLILDVNDEYTTIPAISPKDIKLFSAQKTVEARRIRPFHPDGRKFGLNDLQNTLFQVLQDYRSGLLLLEDLNRYVSDNLPNDIVGAICTNRHTDTDIIIHFQSIGRITPKIWQNINWLRFHKNTDAVERHRSKYIDKEEMLTLAEIIVNNQYFAGNERYYLYVEIEDERIRGNISEQMINEALDEYIYKNEKKLVKPLMRGLKKLSETQALQEVKSKLRSTYFK